MSTIERSEQVGSAPETFDLQATGRILFATPFVIFGLVHFMQGGAMAGVVPGWVPGGVFWVYATGAANLAAGAALAANRYVRPTALALVAMLSVFILTVHLPGLFAEGQMQMAMTSLLKDLGLAGGALLIAGRQG